MIIDLRKNKLQNVSQNTSDVDSFFFSSLPKAKNTSLYSLRILSNYLKQLIARVKKVKRDIRNTLFSNKKT